MMIIQLFEYPDYPMRIRTNPNWERLPTGYFTCDIRKNKNLEKETKLSIPGTFHYHPTNDDIRPTTNDKFLAVFAFKATRYIFISNLHIHGFQNLRKKVFKNSTLTLFDLIREW